MWRYPSSRSLFRALVLGPVNLTHCLPAEHLIRPWVHLCSTVTPASPPARGTPDSGSKDSMSSSEAKRLDSMEALKRKLSMETEEVIEYRELLEACKGMGITRTKEEAVAFAKVLDDAGVVLLFGDKVYLRPEKVVDLMRRAIPLALTPENDPRREEIKELQKKKEEIDMLAHKQVRRILWSGLGFFIVQGGLFFRLTFWEFSWDVMEPIAFFTTTTGIFIGYAYFLFTSRDPTYQDLMKRLFLSRQKKLYQEKNFNMERFKELQRHCKCPSDHTGGTELDAIHSIRKD